MSALELFIKKAFPAIEPDLARQVAAELLRGKPSPEYEEEIADLKLEAGLLRQEIGNLNTRLIRQRDGIENASLAALDVLGERARQRRVEGYTDEHDDELDDFSLSAAAMAYISDARLRGTTGRGFESEPPIDWPYGHDGWRPKQIRRSLEVAASLLIAEMEKIDRQTSREQNRLSGGASSRPEEP